jgi:hypothetical protein
VTDAPPERRDLQTIIGDMRVDVAQIKTRLELQTGVLARLENKLDMGVFREEYERRQKEVVALANKAVEEASAARDDIIRRQGEGRVWRYVFTAALAALGLVEAVLHRA